MDSRTELPPNGWFDEAAFTRLIQEARVPRSTERAWMYLEAAHVVGQLHFRPHVRPHVQMLKLALHSHDWREAAGQGLRLALAPLGHLSGRLPLGNPGRSTIGAFERLPVRPDLADLIALTRDQRKDHRSTSAGCAQSES